MEDVETGLHYFGYRYYNAHTGRWLSADPLGERGGNTLYSFANNAPSEYFDSLGLAAQGYGRANPYDVMQQGPREGRHEDTPAPPGASTRGQKSYSWKKVHLEVAVEECPCTPGWIALVWKAPSPWLDVGYESEPENTFHERGHNINATISFRRSANDITPILKRCVEPQRRTFLVDAAANRKDRFAKYLNLLDLVMHLQKSDNPLDEIKKTTLPIADFVFATAYPNKEEAKYADLAAVLLRVTEADKKFKTDVEFAFKK